MTSFVGSDMFAICFGLPAGHPFDAGLGVVVVVVVVVAAGFRITAVGTEVAVLCPSALIAVTRKRSVLPTSAEVSVYLNPCAPLITAQLPPFSSQRSQE